MFSQVVLAEKDRRYHGLLWRDLDLTKSLLMSMKQFIWFSETSIPLPRSIHGLEWSTSEDEDVFTFTVKEINLSFYTKQGLLSRIATLFDPLQFLAPYVIGTKMALQEAWMG